MGISNEILLRIEEIDLINFIAIAKSNENQNMHVTQRHGGQKEIASIPYHIHTAKESFINLEKERNIHKTTGEAREVKSRMLLFHGKKQIHLKGHQRRGSNKYWAEKSVTKPSSSRPKLVCSWTKEGINIKSKDQVLQGQSFDTWARTKAQQHQKRVGRQNSANYSKNYHKNTENTGKSYHDFTYWCWNILFAVFFRFADVFLTCFIVVTKQRAAFVGHLETSQPTKGRSAVFVEIVCAQGVYTACSFKMADVEDDEKFLYGGKLKILRFYMCIQVCILLPDDFLPCSLNCCVDLCRNIFKIELLCWQVVGWQMVGESSLIWISAYITWSEVMIVWKAWLQYTSVLWSDYKIKINIDDQ